jgi:hypothetical protein
MDFLIVYEFGVMFSILIILYAWANDWIDIFRKKLKRL